MAIGLTVLVLLGGCGEQDPKPPSDLAGAPSGAAGAAIERGGDVYQANCSACHGVDLRGTERGPAMLTDTYVTMPDANYYAAVEGGVDRDNRYGPMPPQVSVDRDDLEAVIAFIRFQQQEAGVAPKP